MSGSGAFSGSGGNLYTEPSLVPDYDRTLYLSLTFTALSQEQYEDNRLQEQICDLLVRLLDLDSSPSVIFDAGSSQMPTSVILVYFPSNSISIDTLESYTRILNSTDDCEWRNLSHNYVSRIASVVLPYYYFCRDWLQLQLVEFTLLCHGGTGY